MPSTNLEKIYISPYSLIVKSFNFQQFFFYDIFLRNAYFIILRVIGRQRLKVYDSQPIFLLIFWHRA